MSDSDILEIKQSLGKVWDALNKLAVEMAKNYVTKEDLKDVTKGMVPTWMALVFPLVTLVVGWLLSRAFPAAQNLIK